MSGTQKLHGQHVWHTKFIPGLQMQVHDGLLVLDQLSQVVSLILLIFNSFEKYISNVLLAALSKPLIQFIGIDRRTRKNRKRRNRRGKGITFTIINHSGRFAGNGGMSSMAMRMVLATTATLIVPIITSYQKGSYRNGWLDELVRRRCYSAATALAFA